ncbi:hypothetical protein GOP47_0003112 [Adiantum capillus-veneris]|uniref:non-specific serine/threonine protein kinase n=1 Tax=Adiantum capillus-veneris TaxID=13818 RepID=A0A9D4VBL4_ADICA|nr:hypothetical protein GOP47_0003112 [Adiantum capillus-veneris]
MSRGAGLLGDQLSQKTGILGLRLWEIVALGVGAFTLLLHITSTTSILEVSKDIKEVQEQPPLYKLPSSVGMGSSVRRQDHSLSAVDILNDEKEVVTFAYGSGGRAHDTGTTERMSDLHPAEAAGVSSTRERQLQWSTSGWGEWYSVEELEKATRQWAQSNIVGKGGYGIVYRGLLPDASVVAVKHLLNVSRLAYLHEDLEPKVVHRDVKSSNILLDSSWNAKVSDFGLAGAGVSHVTTRVMGTFGYVAPEYASTGLLTESSDVYSFGVLMMEVITGRDPVDYSRPTGEMNLVEWMKRMVVGSKRWEEVVDPRLLEKPSGRALKRALLVALRCVDPDALHRPRMGHVVYMLEADDLAFHHVCMNSRSKLGVTADKSFGPVNDPHGQE